MNKNKISFPSVATEVILLDGGLNESVSSIEMKPGELIVSKNYYITEGSTGGYTSLTGFERYDGTALASSIPLVDGDDTNREAARSAILPVPGEGKLLGLYLYKGKLHAFRNKVGGATAGMYVESPAGWVEIDTSSEPLNPNGIYSFLTYNYAGGADTEYLYWANGVDNCRFYDGTAVTKIVTGMTVDTPTFLTAHGERIWLAYAGGSLQYSAAGDPTDWTALSSAGEIGVGYEITGLAGSVGDTLVVFGRDHIKILEGSDTASWVFRSYSDAIGAIPYTICKLFDTLIFANDMGVTLLSAAQEFGDFSTSAISERVKKTFLKYKQNITCATVFKHLNQYRLYFDNGKHLVFSFRNKKIRGATLCEYSLPVDIVTEGKNSTNDPVNYFGGATGHTYRMDSGTSFDGNAITHQLYTAYYYYKQPRFWKRFFRITFEITSVDDLIVNIQPTYDYRGIGYSSTGVRELEVPGAGDLWGEADWGEMVWASNEVTNRIFYDFQGIGGNMSVKLFYTSKYSRQHTLQNMIVDYATLGRQM